MLVIFVLMWQCSTVQSNAVCAIYFISVQCNTLPYSTVQHGYCCVVELSAFKFSHMKMVLVSKLLSTQVKILVCKKVRYWFYETTYLVLNIHSDCLIYYSVQYIAVHCKSTIFYTVNFNESRELNCCALKLHIF